MKGRRKPVFVFVTVYLRARGQVREWGARCECTPVMVCVGAGKGVSVGKGAVRGDQTRFKCARGAACEGEDYGISVRVVS